MQAKSFRGKKKEILGINGCAGVKGQERKGWL